MLADSLLVRRRPYVMFWWWTAVALAVWSPVRFAMDDLVASATGRERLWWAGCVREDGRAAGWRHTAEGIAGGLGAGLLLIAPVLLVILIVAVRRHGEDRPEAHVRAARAAVLVLAAAEALLLVRERVAPSALDPACVERFAPPDLGSAGIAFTWLVSAPAAVLIAAGAATLARPARALTATAAALVLPLAGVTVVEWLPELRHVLTGPELTAEGTPRYVLVGSSGPRRNWSDSGSELHVLDLATGKPVGQVDLPGEEYGEYTSAARAREPGEYIAAATVSVGGNDDEGGSEASEVFRITLDARGRPRVGEKVSPALAGAVTSLDVSPSGRVGYARVATNAVGTSFPFLGVVGRSPDWPSQGAHKVQWAGDRTLLSLSEGQWEGPVVNGGLKPERGWVPALDVERREITRHPLGAPPEAGLLARLPGGRTIVADARDGRPRLVVHDGPTAIGTLFVPARGRILSMALDRAGTHLLVGQDNQSDPNKHPTEWDHELHRVDLRPLAGVPTPPQSSFRDLNPPRRLVWHGMHPVATIAW
ncbi:hypothetical protein [Bailinhaonella thermotolerans]|uniref:hypothetical protein n=1 Tax=Bailinhaonella thermotolerans TaxID=1070861 RepID=UPI00192A6235|nr:hypothetical protein [Bailinhaonella thermotolerans]